MKHRYPSNALKVFSVLTTLLLVAGSLMPIQGIGLAAPVNQEAGPSAQQTAMYRGYSTAVKFDVSPALRDLAQLAVEVPSNFQDTDLDSGLEGALGLQDVDPSVQTQVGQGEIPAPSISFDGFSNVAGYTPPDPVGDVGPDHYVAMANVHFAVYDKSGNLLLGPLANNTLWSGFGGDCETDNSGDPIVIYDQLADRWMLTQFTASGPTYFNCVALSMTGDPTGQYYRWAFSTGINFPDYPKYGVWPDAYYISTREFENGGPFVGVGAYALNRDEMLAGDPNPGVVSFLTGTNPMYNVGDGLLPSDLDGTILPPAGSPNYYMGSMDNGAGYGAPQDALTLWKFHVDWVTPGNSYFTLTSTIPTDPFDSIYPCAPSSRECIPQPGTGVKIDILSYRQRPLWRLAYRNFGTYEALVTNQSVEASTNMAGIRWYEIRDPNGTPVIYQQGTYAPGISDGIHRWMGSIAMDRDGNMGLGYSASNSSTTYPSSWYTGRLVSDPLGTMSQGEGVIVNGLGSQLSTGHRWGDYTSMNIDPVDDCTFWYINEYYPSTSNTGWRLRIGAFKYPTCGTGQPIADLSVEKIAEPNIVVPGETITYTVTATNNGPDDVPTATLTDTLPAGFFLQGASLPPDWTCGFANQVINCSKSTMGSGSFPFVFFGTAPMTTGYITNTVEIAGDAFDPVTSNNSTTVVTLVDSAPVAGDDDYNTTEDLTLVVPAPGVLSNDTDADGNALSAYLNAPPSNGSVSLNIDGSFQYTPDPNFYGTDSFTYLVNDGYLTDQATVQIDVSAVNDAPVAVDDSYGTQEDVPLAVPAPGVLGNDYDVDGDILTPTVVTPPVNGDLVLALDGSFNYTPTLNFNGLDYFAYMISDGVLTDQAVVTITVSSVNDNPIVDIGGDRFADEGQELVLTGTVSDPGLNSLPLGGLDLVWDLGDGTLVTGTLSVTHTYVDNGVYTVTLTATDGEGGVGVDTLLATVANVAPVLDGIPDQAGTVGEAVQLAAGYADPGILDTQTVAIDWGDGMTETLELAAGGNSFNLSHVYQEAGIFNVTVTITDKDGGFSDQTFTINVEPSVLFMFIPVVYK